MRRGLPVLLALLLFGTTTWAQGQLLPTQRTQVQFPPTAATVLAGVSADEVVARMMSFDRNSDGRVEKGELAERMHNLVARGDVDGDGALNGSEVRTLANTPAPQTGGRGGFQGSGSYGFADQTSFSSRSHIDGALEDLRLASPAKEQASAIAKGFVDTLEAAAAADLLKAIDPLLSTGQSLDFKAAIAKSESHPECDDERRRQQGCPRHPARRNGSHTPDQTYQLPPAEKAAALALVEQYKTRLRLGDAERSQLLEQMGNLLNAEERDNFRAALERRPVVETGNLAGFFVSHNLNDLSKKVTTFGVSHAILRSEK